MKLLFVNIFIVSMLLHSLVSCAQNYQEKYDEAWKKYHHDYKFSVYGGLEYVGPGLGIRVKPKNYSIEAFCGFLSKKEETIYNYGFQINKNFGKSTFVISLIYLKYLSDKSSIFYPQTFYGPLFGFINNRHHLGYHIQCGFGIENSAVNNSTGMSGLFKLGISYNFQIKKNE